MILNGQDCSCEISWLDSNVLPLKKCSFISPVDHEILSELRNILSDCFGRLNLFWPFKEVWYMTCTIYVPVVLVLPLNLIPLLLIVLLLLPPQQPQPHHHPQVTQEDIIAWGRGGVSEHSMLSGCRDLIHQRTVGLLVWRSGPHPLPSFTYVVPQIWKKSAGNTIQDFPKVFATVNVHEHRTNSTKRDLEFRMVFFDTAEFHLSFLIV